jgi:RND family efflux transporter MFP subunit
MKIHPLHLALFATLSVTLAACSKDTPAPKTAAVHRSVSAQVTTLSAVTLPEYRVTPGTVVAEQSVKVASRLMGYIRDIAVAEGQPIKAGQRLFTIDPIDIQGQVELASAGLKQAEDAAADAKADFERFAALFKDDVVTRQQYEKMKLNYDIAVSRVAQARSGLNTARGQLRYAVVTSPIDGVVTQKLANVGDIAAPGHPVLLIENPARLQVQTSVDENVFRTLKPGQAVTVDIDGHAGAVTARVARISPAADPMTHTYTVKLDLPAVGGVKSGSFARVRFEQGRRTALTVPQSAVLDRAGITGVFVVDASGSAQFRMIRTGRSDDGRIEVVSGLVAGERVVTGNAQALQNGDRVQG